MSRTRRHPPLQDVYRALFAQWGPQHWWPGRTRFEIIAGAILTQNTAWTNVEKAIRRLRKERALTLDALHRAPDRQVAEWIRPAGFFRLKARRLKAFTRMVTNDFEGHLSKLFALDTNELRHVLLDVNGIGPETADSILLYAAHRPVFVVDAYTRRILSRHGWLAANASYDEVAACVTAHIPRDIQMYNEYHALLVRLAKEYCRTKPRCAACPLRPWLPRGRKGGTPA